MISIKNLCFSYTKGSDLLKNINLDIPQGVYVSVLGDNGSCKSTLMKLILGLLSPNSGSIDISSNKISYVPQRLDNFNPDFPITVKEILSTHAKAIGIKDRHCVSDSLGKVNMKNFEKKLIGNLSGGQQQRIFIAKALIGNPDLIILDEPSTGIDEKSQNEIYPILQTLNTEYGKTIISVEHNTKVALKYSTHILKIHNGNVELYTKSDYIKRFKHEQCLVI